MRDKIPDLKDFFFGLLKRSRETLDQMISKKSEVDKVRKEAPDIEAAIKARAAKYAQEKAKEGADKPKDDKETAHEPTSDKEAFDKAKETANETKSDKEASDYESAIKARAAKYAQEKAKEGADKPKAATKARADKARVDVVNANEDAAANKISTVLSFSVSDRSTKLVDLSDTENDSTVDLFTLSGTSRPARPKRNIQLLTYGHEGNPVIYLFYIPKFMKFII